MSDNRSSKPAAWARTAARSSALMRCRFFTISAVRDEAGLLRHYVAVFSDVTQARETELRLENIAHFDVLTGLPNRVLLFDRLRQCMAQCQRRASSLAVAFLDLDGFKEVNDRYGHALGDQMLIALARRMGDALREGDTLARVGGDEFVVVMADLDGPQHFEPLVQRLLMAASEPVALALLAASGPATPSMAPSPLLAANSFGYLLSLRSVEYDRNVGISAPPAGIDPKGKPIRVPRSHAGIERFQSARVIHNEVRRCRLPVSSFW